jgi:hypothetical protein
VGIYIYIYMERWAPLPIKVKMDGAGFYGFGLAGEQSGHEVVCRRCEMNSIEYSE